MLTYLLFIVGFVLIVKGAGLLVDGASSMAKNLKVSDIVIGLTVVAFGTSMPEFTINLFANYSGDSQIAIGNIIGANILDILVVLGVSLLICPLAISRTTTWVDIPLSLISAVLLGLLANDVLLNGSDASSLGRFDGILLLLFFAFFMFLTFRAARRKSVVEELDDGLKKYSLAKSSLITLLGLLFLAFGARWVVNGAVEIATVLGVSQSFIALTIVSFGTTLPELAASTTAACRKNAGIAVGNVVGSTIFNTFFILGFSSTLKPLPFNTMNNIDVGMLILANIMLFAFVFIGKEKYKLKRWQGGVFILTYLVYLAFLISRH